VRPRKNPNRLNSLVDEQVYSAVMIAVARRARERGTTPQAALRSVLEECISLHPIIAPILSMVRVISTMVPEQCIAPEETPSSALHVEDEQPDSAPMDLDTWVDAITMGDR
jgi:hypothetical protein